MARAKMVTRISCGPYPSNSSRHPCPSTNFRNRQADPKRPLAATKSLGQKADIEGDFFPLGVIMGQLVEGIVLNGLKPTARAVGRKDLPLPRPP